MTGSQHTPLMYTAAERKLTFHMGTKDLILTCTKAEQKENKDIKLWLGIDPNSEVQVGKTVQKSHLLDIPTSPTML